MACEIATAEHLLNHRRSLLFAFDDRPRSGRN